MMKNRKAIYIISILNAIYLIYLLCRPFQYPVLGITVISIIVISLSIFLTHKWLNDVKKAKLASNKKKLTLLTVFCTLFLIGYFYLGGGGYIFY